MQARDESIRVLHVDDEPDFAEMAATFVERHDQRFDIETETDPADGLERLASDDFDCVISDFDMPGMDGIEFLERIREDYPDLPVILFTGKGSEDVASDAISAGVTDYLQKGSGTSQYAVLANRIRNAVDKYFAQTELADRERRLDLFFEQSPLGVIEWDEDFDIVRLNAAAEEILGYPEDELVGRSWNVIVPESDREPVEEIVSELLENTGGYHSINENVRKDGTRIVCEWHNRVVTDEDGDVVAVFSQFQDISERTRRERAIEKLHRTTDAIIEATTSESAARIAVEAVEDIIELPANGVHLYDEDEGGLAPVAWTERTEELVGEPPVFAVGEGIAGTAFETGEPQIYDDITTVPERYNPETPVRSQIAFPLDGHGVLLIGSEEVDAFTETDSSLAKILARHLTTALDRIEREDQLELMEQIVEEMNDGAVIVADGVIRYTNPRVSELIGYADAELTGEPAAEFVAPADRETVDRRHRQLSGGDGEELPAKYRIDLLSEAGDRVPVELNVSRIEYDGRPATLSLVRDVTERTRREQILKRQNERLDKFASVVSHDLRNPLNVAQGRIELAREACDTEHLVDAADAVDRSLRLIDDLLTLARTGERISETEPVDLAETVRQCWRNVETGGAAVVIETAETILADESRFQQLLENLVRNAVEHGGEDVTVTVGTLDRSGFYIEDDGPGIPEGKREQVFEAGYSTAAEGTGFGLNIVREIVEAHGWDIGVTASEEGGARFEITGVEFT